MDDLLEFLDQAGDQGLMSAATAQALAVAARNVLGVLSDDERADLRHLDIDATIRRFTNKRAKDFNPSSLNEYGRRVRRAVELFLSWCENPANFMIKTRGVSALRKKEKGSGSTATAAEEAATELTPVEGAGTYRTSIPVRPDLVVTLVNIPNDLTSTEAERIADFVRMLALK